MRKLYGLIIFAGALVGCNTGDVPTENVPTTASVTPTQTTPGTQPQSQTEAIQGNPNIPQVAKDAVLGGKK